MATQFETRTPASFQGREQDVFFIPVEFLGVAALATRTQTLTVDQDADMVIVGAARLVTDAATDVTPAATPPFVVSFKMVGSGRDLMSGAVHMETLFGTAQQPAAWPRGKVIKRAESMRVTITNLSGTAYNVRLTFYGFKVFPA